MIKTRPTSHVTDSSLDLMQIDDNRWQKLHGNLLLWWLQPVEES